MFKAKWNENIIIRLYNLQGKCSLVTVNEFCCIEMCVPHFIYSWLYPIWWGCLTLSSYITIENIVARVCLCKTGHECGDLPTARWGGANSCVFTGDAPLLQLLCKMQYPFHIQISYSFHLVWASCRVWVSAVGIQSLKLCIWAIWQFTSNVHNCLSVFPPYTSCKRTKS